MTQSSQDNNAPAHKPILDYAPKPRRWRRRLWGIAVLLISIAGGYGAAVWGPLWLHAARLSYWQARSQNYTAPRDQIVFASDPYDVKNFAKDKRYVSAKGWYGSTVELRPDCWDAFIQQITPAPTVLSTQSARGSVIFLGELTTPAGNRRIVAVILHPTTRVDSEYRFNLEYYVVTPGTIQSSPVFGPSPLNSAQMAILSATKTNLALPSSEIRPLGPGANARFYAGQKDPADPSHFTIRYETGGLEDTIDGRLDNQDHITLKQQHPPPKIPPYRPPTNPKGFTLPWPVPERKDN